MRFIAVTTYFRDLLMVGIELRKCHSRQSSLTEVNLFCKANSLIDHNLRDLHRSITDCRKTNVPIDTFCHIDTSSDQFSL